MPITITQLVNESHGFSTRLIVRALLIYCKLAIILILTYAGNVFAASSSPFDTDAKFSVDSSSLHLSSAVAVIEPHFTQGYYWVRIHFYSFSPIEDDIANITKGNVKTMDTRWNKLVDKGVDAYNTGNSVIQLTVDKDFNVTQVDMSIPGHSCTIAPFEKEVKAFLQTYKFDGKKLELKSKGSYVCDMAFMKVSNQKFDWDINLNTEVFKKQ